MESLPGYDAWKLATPPEYERESDGEHTPECDAEEESRLQSIEDALLPRPPCNCFDDESDDAYDRYVDQKIDEWKESR